MTNTYCPYCQAIYPVDGYHDCIGSLRARIKELEQALLPFLNISERADYSIGEIKQSDIQHARSLIND